MHGFVYCIPGEILQMNFHVSEADTDPSHHAVRFHSHETVFYFIVSAQLRLVPSKKAGGLQQKVVQTTQEDAV